MNYSVAEFRKNIRIALDAVERGEDVHITRHNKTFAIIKADFNYLTTTKVSENIRPDIGIDLGKKDEQVEVVTRFERGGKQEIISINGKPPKKNSRLATPRPINKGTKDYSVCKHGAVKGFCKKGCK